MIADEHAVMFHNSCKIRIVYAYYYIYIRLSISNIIRLYILDFELNNRIKILQNTSEQTLHCCKKLTLILHELNLYIYLNYDPG